MAGEAIQIVGAGSICREFLTAIGVHAKIGRVPETKGKSFEEIERELVD